MAALRSVPAADWAWCASCTIAWLPVLGNLWGTERISHPRGLAAYVDLSFVLTPAVLGVLTCVYLACVVCWTLRARPAACAVVGFALLALLGNVENSLYDGDNGVHHGKLMPAAALLAWAITWSLNGHAAASERERHAQEAVIGVAAACYVLAAIAKLHSGGLDWVNNTSIALLMAERAIGAASWLGELRNFLARVGAGAGSVALSLPALLIELFGVALLWPRTRRWAAALLISLHLGIALLLGYIYVAWMLLLLGVLLRPLVRRPDRATSGP